MFLGLVLGYKPFLLSWPLPENVNLPAHPFTFHQFLTSCCPSQHTHTPPPFLQSPERGCTGSGMHRLVAGLHGLSRGPPGCASSWRAWSRHRAPERELSPVQHSVRGPGHREGDHKCSGHTGLHPSPGKLDLLWFKT